MKNHLNAVGIRIPDIRKPDSSEYWFIVFYNLTGKGHMTSWTILTQIFQMLFWSFLVKFLMFFTVSVQFSDSIKNQIIRLLDSIGPLNIFEMGVARSYGSSMPILRNFVQVEILQNSCFAS